jgi:acetylornithine deacetylase/succinyl-diaminopimelate desuccinylase-like protein
VQQLHVHQPRRAQGTQLIADWCKKQPVKGLTVEIVEHAPRTPIIFMEVPATTPGSDDAVLLYGHLDKQPEMSGWAEGLSPWTPGAYERATGGTLFLEHID